MRTHDERETEFVEGIENKLLSLDAEGRRLSREVYHQAKLARQRYAKRMREQSRIPAGHMLAVPLTKELALAAAKDAMATKKPYEAVLGEYHQMLAEVG
jgi:hypothetical protein